MPDANKANPSAASGTDASSTHDAEHRPPLVLMGLVAMAVVALVVVALATRDSADPEQEAVSTRTTFAPPAAPPQPTTPVVQPTLSERSQPTPTTASDSVGRENDKIEFLPFHCSARLGLRLDPAVVASLPTDGINGWLFARDANARLTRTDLTTGEQVSLDLSEGRPTEFFPFPVPLAVLGTTLVWAGGDRVVLIDVVTLESEVIDHGLGFASIVAHDQNTVWLSSLDSLFSVNVETSVLTEVLGADAIERGNIGAGAHAGVIRYSIPLRGSWELRDGQNTRVENVIAAGTLGGTLEIECAEGPNDCTMVIRDMGTGISTPIDVSPQESRVSLSPNLDAVATGFEIVRTNGSRLALEPEVGSWLWSNDGQFVSRGDLTVIDAMGDTPTFQIPGRSLGFREAALVVLRVET